MRRVDNYPCGQTEKTTAIGCTAVLQSRVPRHHRGSIRYPLKPSEHRNNNVLMGALNWVPMMPRDASDV